MWAAHRKPLLPLSELKDRALLCAGDKAKLFLSSTIRAAVLPALDELVADNQSGAVQKGGTEFPMRLGEAVFFCLWAADRRIFAALRFGDMKKAYYSVILELMVGPLLTCSMVGNG